MARKELTEEQAHSLIQIANQGVMRGIALSVRHYLTGNGFLRREGEGIHTTYQVTVKGFRALEREYPEAMKTLGCKGTMPVPDRQNVLLTEFQARDIFEAAEVCLNEGIAPDMVDTLQALASTFPEIRDDKGCMSTLEWMGGKAPGKRD